MPAKRRELNDLAEVGRGPSNTDAASDFDPANSDADVAFGARIEQLVALVGGVGPLSHRTGVSRRMIDKYRKGVDPSRSRLISLAQGAGVSLLWLATGEGEMARISGLPDGTDVLSAGPEFMALPRYDVEAAAGQGAVVVSDHISEWVYFRREWLKRELGVNPRQLAMIVAVGDSMAPTIGDGDLLIVDATERRWTRDGVYVIGVEDDLWVKRVDRLSDGSLVLSSDNPQHRHGAETIAKAHIDTVRVVGRVVWVGGRI